jgi:endonuclease G
VPWLFRNAHEKYAEVEMDDGSTFTFDRGHLVPAANHSDDFRESSDTFLMSNMAPQHEGMNQQEWRVLEQDVRSLLHFEKRKKIKNKYHVLKVIHRAHVISGPIFYFNQAVKEVPHEEKGMPGIPVPNAFFKTVLAEDAGGNLHLWSFIMPNEDVQGSPSDYLVPTRKVEKYAGIHLFPKLSGELIEVMKQLKSPYWMEPSWGSKKTSWSMMQNRLGRLKRELKKQQREDSDV